MPLISIIIPLFNREKLISETLNSVISQTYKNWEVIIVDDGSTDNSIEIVKEFQKKDKRIKLYKRDRKPKGATTCRNIGAKLSKGEYLIFLDSDDLLKNYCFKQRIDVINEDKNLDFAVFNMNCFQNKIGDLNKSFNLYFENNYEYLYSFLTDAPPWQTMCPIWKKDFFLKIGGFDENFWIMDDPELHTRAILHPNVNFKVIENSKPDCYYRIDSPYSKMSDKFINDSIVGRIQYFEKTFTYISNLSIPNVKKNEYKKNLRVGIIILYKKWMLSRIKLFQNEYENLLVFCKQNKILNFVDFKLIKINKFLWTNDNWFFRILKLKGLFAKFLK